MRKVCSLALIALLVPSPTISKQFSPKEYTKSVAKCPAINRKEGKVVDINIQYVDINPTAPRTLIMVHGWPSLWSSWSHQILEFKDQYHIIAPDNRGFGNSTHPGDVEGSSTMGDIVGDLTCVMKHAGVDEAICVGHDWGAQICWEAARQRPDVFTAVVGAVVPYITSDGPFIPTSALVHSIPRLKYQLFFQRMTTEAIIELNEDIRRTLRATLRGVQSPPPKEFLTQNYSYLDAWREHKNVRPIPFFTQEEEDYFVEQYEIQGFNFTLGFYTEGNRRGSYDFAHAQGNFTIPQPALAIYPVDDPVADWLSAAAILGSHKFLPKLTVKTIPAAHWPQLERPDEFNEILKDWLVSIEHGSPTGESTPMPEVHPEIHEEL